jgi:hypothetical protein
MALLEINGKRYQRIEANSATLADYIALKRQTGLGLADLQAVLAQFEDLDDADIESLAASRPDLVDDMLLATGVSVWLTRRHAGEDLTLEQACAVRMEDIRSIPEPGDHAEPKGKKAKRSESSHDPR